MSNVSEMLLNQKYLYLDAQKQFLAWVNLRYNSGGLFQADDLLIHLDNLISLQSIVTICGPGIVYARLNRNLPYTTICVHLENNQKYDIRLGNTHCRIH